MEMEDKKSEAYRLACEMNQKIFAWCEEHNVYTFSDLIKHGSEMDPSWFTHLDGSLNGQTYVINHLFSMKEKADMAAARKRILGERTKRTILPCFCIDTGKHYKSVREAARDIHAMPLDVTKCCLGLTKTVKGLHFAYDLEAIKG